MSQSNAHDEHSSPIKTPKQLVTTVVAAFVVPIVVIVLLVKNISTDARSGAGAQAMTPEAVAERIQPVGRVAIKLEGGALRTGEEVFKGQCSGCHAAGALGAPKFGDAGAWGPRIGQGLAGLLNSALKGKGNMTPQGGGDFSDVEVARGVVYMANAGGAKFEEPKAPAGAADAAAK
ncbi:MAG: cytochrome c5 family protein [Leptothrix sp. (in: b-proteobacteria)]